MKKLIILFSIVLSCASVMSQQEWAPTGSRWYYNKPSSSDNTYVLIESVRDSVIQGKDVRILEVKLNGINLVSLEYVYQEEESLFYYNKNDEEFHLLYNFAANKDDVVVVYENEFQPTKAFFSSNNTLPSFKYKITDVDDVVINEKTIKRQFIENLDNSLWGFVKPTGMPNYILDKIGSLSYFFGVFSGTIPEEQPSILRCYIEPGFEYKNSSWEYNCDLTSRLNKNKDINSGIFCYPNPTDNILNIETTQNIKSIEILNMDGKLIENIEGDKKCIDISHLNKGWFLLNIKTNDNVYLKKIIKR